MREPTAFVLRREIVRRGGDLTALALAAGISEDEAVCFVIGSAPLTGPQRKLLAQALEREGVPVQPVRSKPNPLKMRPSP